MDLTGNSGNGQAAIAAVPTNYRITMAKKSFEISRARLEEITTEREDGELSLDKSLKKFEEGIQLARFCNEQLAEARAKVELLLDKDGQLLTVPFTESDSEHHQLPE